MNSYRRAPLDHARAQAAIATLTDVICGPHPLHGSQPARILASCKLTELLREVELDQTGEIVMRRPYDTGRAPGRGGAGGIQREVIESAQAPIERLRAIINPPVTLGGGPYGKTTLDK
jgi:hypothetical protein